MPNTPYASTATRKADTLEDSAAKIMRAALGKDSQFSRVADESKVVPMPVKYGEPQAGDNSSYLKGLNKKIYETDIPNANDSRQTRIGQYGTSIPNANDSRQTRIGQYGTSIPNANEAKPTTMPIQQLPKGYPIGEQYGTSIPNANEAKPTTMPIQQLPKGYPIGGGAVAGPKAVAAGPIDKPIAPVSSDNASFLKGLVNSADKVLTGVSPAYGVAKTMYEDYKKKPNK